MERCPNIPSAYFFGIIVNSLLLLLPASPLCKLCIDIERLLIARAYLRHTFERRAACVDLSALRSWIDIKIYLSLSHVRAHFFQMIQCVSIGSKHASYYYVYFTCIIIIIYIKK